MDNKLRELKDALEFLETTEFDGEWDSALVGGDNGENYHAVINANDVVVRADDDSRHTSWVCDYLEAVSPVNIRALLAELEAKDKRIAELEGSHKKLRLTLAAIHNTITGGGAYTSLAGILTAVKRAYLESSDASASTVTVEGDGE